MLEYAITSSVSYSTIVYSYCNTTEGVLYETVYEFKDISPVFNLHNHKKTS